MRFIQVEGAHKDMGISQGEEVKLRLPKFLKATVESELWKAVKPKFLPNWLIFSLGGVYARGMLKRYLQRFPHQYERIRGIAQGAEVSPNLIFAIQASEAVGGDTKQHFEIPGCTSLIFSSEATKGKEIILGKNYDIYYNLLDFQIVRISKPEGRYSSLCLTQDFLAGNHNGVNECGLVIIYTYAYPWEDYSLEGVPTTILIQEALETCKDTESAISFFEKTIRSNGANLGLADEKGNVCVLETSKSKIKIRKPENGRLIHTNHYLHSEMIPLDTPNDAVHKMNHPQVKGKNAKLSSLLRYKRAEELAKANTGNLSEEMLMNIFRDHGEENDPSDNTICRHAELWGTLSSVIFYPQRRALKVVEGNPCQGEYKMYELK